MIRLSPRCLGAAGRTLLATALSLLAGFAPAQTITTAVGGGPDTGLATQRCVGFPYQVALDAAGNRYIATGPLHLVVKIDTFGVLSVIAGNGADDSSGDGGPATSAGLRSPTGVAVDTTSGDVYIADSSVHKIRKVTAGSGIISTFAGQGFAAYGPEGVVATSSALSSPNHLAFSTGFLYIADTGNHRIRRINLSTSIIALVAGNGTPGFLDGSATSAEFNSPNGVAVDSGGANVYVADTLNQCVRRINGGVTSTIAGIAGSAGYNGDGSPATNFRLFNPEGVAVDSAGAVYVADELNFRIRKLVGTTISTVAGGTSGFGGDLGPPLSAAMQQPYSVAVDTSFNLHIADTFNSRLRVVSGGIINTVGGNGTVGFSGDPGPATGATMRQPSHVALDPAGSKLYIADELNARIRRVDLGTGVITTVAGNGTLGFSGNGGLATNAQLRQPQDMAVDGTGNLYIADTVNNCVRKVDTSGIISTYAGTCTVTGFSGDTFAATSALMNTPRAVALDAAGNLYIADSGNNRIRKVNTSGIITTFAGTAGGGYDGEGPATAHKLNTPSGVAVDGAGNVYVADWGNHRIRKIDPGGTISTVAGSGPPGSFGGDSGPAVTAKLNLPRGVAVDTVGNILIADTSNHRVRMVEGRTGRITTVAAMGTPGFAGDGGPAVAAKLNMPYGVAVNGVGRVFVSDQFNNRIRTMTLGTDLAIMKDDAQTFAIPGMSVSYLVRVTNNGPNPVTSVNVIDTPPAILTGLTYAPCCGSTYTLATGDWTGLSLGVGGSVDLIVTGNISSSATGSLTNTVKVAPPLGLTDPMTANDQWQDTDALTPQADLSITLSDAPDPLPVGSVLTYTIVATNNGPSDATTVSVSDTLPATGVIFQTASAPCTELLGTVSCNLGSLAASTSAPPITITVITTATGTLSDTASVTFVGTDTNLSNNTKSVTTVVNPAGPDTARYLTVTSKDSTNILEWLNPVGFGNVRINFKSGATSCVFPTDPTGVADGSTILVPFLAGTPDQPGRFPHTPITNTNHYCYTVWVDKGGPYSSGKSIKGRPFVVLPGPGAKWGYNMGIFSMVPPGNGVGAVYAVAQDGSLHSMVKGAGIPDGGTWPAPITGFPLTWKPQSMNGPSQGRPSGIPVATIGSTRTIFLSSQDGHVYAFNAETGARAWSPSSPLLAPTIQAHPSGVFTVFGGTRDLIFVGTRDAAGSQFYALRLQDGDNVAAPGWVFDGGGTPGNKIGAINGQAAVDQVARRVYFASREFDAANNKTVWCLDLETGVPCTGFTPLAHGNIDTGVSLYGNRLLVGSNDATATDPEVKAINTIDGSEAWSYPLPIPEGAPKGYVAVDRLTGNSYFSTATTVWSLDSAGAWRWQSPLLSPSIPVYAPGDVYVYVGAGDGKLYRLDWNTGLPVLAAPFPLPLGDGSAAVGSPTYDLAAGFMYVGTEDGVVYAIQLF